MYLIISLSIYGLAMTITPGPNNLMLMTSGLNYGIIKTLQHVIGIWIGNLVMLFAVILGIGILFDHYHFIHIILKICSSIFLLYLSWKFASASPKDLNVSDKGKPLTFFQAFSFQLVNPKAWIFVITAVSAFSKNINFTEQFIFMGSILSVTMLFSCFSWLIGGYYLRKLLKSEKQQRLFNLTMGVLLALTVIPIFLASLK